MSGTRLNPYYPGKMAVIRKERAAGSAVQRAIDAAWAAPNPVSFRFDAGEHRGNMIEDCRFADPMAQYRALLEPMVWVDEFADPPRPWWKFWR